VSALATNEIDLTNGERPSLALDIPQEQSFEDWEAMGRKLCASSQVINWWIGDWWAAGNHRYGERAKKAAEGIFGREFGSLMNLASICRSFEGSRRREVLSFTHHVEVAALPPAEADALLDKAERLHWSTRDLREAVACRRGDAYPDGRNVLHFERGERTNYDRTEAKEAIFDRLNLAAERGEICPIADELQEIAGVQSVSTTVALMHSLEEDKRITVERYQRSRVVTITGTGKSTATPNDMTPHWRSIPRDVPTPQQEAIREKRPDVARDIFLEARRLGKSPAEFLVDLVFIGWDVWSSGRAIQVGASEGLI